ncbi:hypothetical protein TELCIR_20303, partial [Teladorsagia circumcincta]
KWVYTVCKDGDQIQREFVDLWRRFANRYKSICHFGFTFITSLTHEAGLTLETLDEYLKSSLENLQISGALDNSVSIIMGDHGNRIGLPNPLISRNVDYECDLVQQLMYVIKKKTRITKRRASAN